VENLREKVAVLTQQLNRQCELQEQAKSRAHGLQDDKTLLESRLNKTEAELSAAEASRDGLRRDKSTVSISHCSCYSDIIVTIIINNISY
jgi:chromosome segregation ATPase